MLEVKNNDINFKKRLNFIRRETPTMVRKMYGKFDSRIHRFSKRKKVYPNKKLIKLFLTFTCLYIKGKNQRNSFRNKYKRRVA